MAADWLAGQLCSGRRVGFPWISLIAYLRMTTNPRLFERRATATRRDPASDATGLNGRGSCSERRPTGPGKRPLHPECEAHFNFQRDDAPASGRMRWAPGRVTRGSGAVLSSEWRVTQQRSGLVHRRPGCTGGQRTPWRTLWRRRQLVGERLSATGSAARSAQPRPKSYMMTFAARREALSV